MSLKGKKIPYMYLFWIEGIAICLAVNEQTILLFSSITKFAVKRGVFIQLSWYRNLSFSLKLLKLSLYI